MKKKVKRYQEGGITINQQATPAELPGMAGYGQSTNGYPFQSDSSASSATGADSGVNQTFNIQPTAQSGQPQNMKRGGKVKAHRGDGIAQRGKTRGRMV
jgi:hypothetical protein